MYTRPSPTISPTVSPPSSPGPYFASHSSRQSSCDTSIQAKNDSRVSASAKRYKYLRRLVWIRQMDFEYAFWQMLYLFYSPQKVYRNFAYRKLSSIGFGFALGFHFTGFIKLFLSVVFVDCIGIGMLVATLFWFVTNKYMIVQPPRGQDVEWGYCFDVHLNAFFPLLMFLHFIQLPLLNLVILPCPPCFYSYLVGNTIWLLALSYYVYITFLGYSALPFLKQTKCLLYPLTGVFCIYLITLVSGVNLSNKLYMFYIARANS